MNPAMKRFNEKYVPVADAIAAVDIDQEDREMIAKAVAEAYEGMRDRDFRRDLFELLSSDPLVPCAGPGEGKPCPQGRLMRQHFHNREDPQGRSLLWQRRAPYGQIRCVSCGSPQFAVPTSA